MKSIMHHSTARRLLAVLALIATQAPAEAAPRDPALQPADRFQQLAQETTKALKADQKFRGFDTEILVARPFVILMTRDPDADPKAIEERKHRLGTLAQGVWRNWLKVRADWQLQSTRNDTLEQPEPFVWVSFHDEAAYARYMKEFRPNGTQGSRAYYSTETHCVYTHEDPHRDPAIILIHETFHQLMDRFSKVGSTQYQNYCFTEGLAEYFAGYKGEGESLELGQLNRPRRAEQIRRFHTHFDDKQNICYPWHERRLQITPDDWIFFDVPMLLTFRDKMWTEAISNALIKHFERSDYVTRQEGKDLVNGGTITFHSAFYAYAWAFTYWLRENHPDQYDRYARTVLNTDRGGDAEVFLESFGIEPARPLPDIRPLVGPNNRDVQKNMQQAVQCLDQRIAILRQTPAIQDMHRQWADWMRTTFPKL